MRKLALAAPVLIAAALVPAHAGAQSSAYFDLNDSNLPVAGPSFADRGGEEIPGEITVDVKDGLSDEEITKLGDDYGINLHDNSPAIKDDANIAIADVDPAREASLIERLKADPRVDWAERTYVAHAYFTPNDPKFSEQWHMSKVGAESAWEYACGTGVTVAVVDTGIACYDKAGFMKGTDLNGTSCVAGYNFVDKNEVAADDQGHGTHVAGTIAQTTNNGIGVAGLANCAKLMPVKVLSKQGWGTMADVAEGIRWAADHGAQVINLSLGSSSKAKVVEDAVVYAYKKGVVVVAAAGNSGRAVGYPAGYPTVIAVSATDQKDGLAWFSSRGPEVAIGAPGVSVTQQTICQNGKNKCEIYGVFNGTSMASPHVAGAAALVVGQGITDPDAVRSTLQKTAVEKGPKEHFGAGILDAAKAVSATHWMHVGLRLAALIGLFVLIAARIKKQGGKVDLKPGVVGGALLGSVGLLPFLPALKVLPRMGSLRPIGEALMRPIGEWDLLVAPSLHKWLALGSAVPVMILTALFLGVRPMRRFTGGLAIGTAALLAQLTLSGEMTYAFGPFALRIWTVLNALVCIWIARIALDAKKA
jgi:serine protease